MIPKVLRPIFLTTVDAVFSFSCALDTLARTSLWLLYLVFLSSGWLWIKNLWTTAFICLLASTFLRSCWEGQFIPRVSTLGSSLLASRRRFQIPFFVVVRGRRGGFYSRHSFAWLENQWTDNSSLIL